MCNIITVEPSFDNMDSINNFIKTKFDDFALEKSAESKLYVAIDEILSNIIKFSEASFVSVECYKKDNVVYLTFTDDGIYFNPLELKDADTSLPLDERKIGGLGIFIVKNSMDYVHYEYVDKKNILTMGLNI